MYLITAILYGLGATLFLFVLSGGFQAWSGKDPYRHSNPLDTQDDDFVD